MSWYAAKSAGRGQGLVIDEENGRNVAVSYDEKDTPLLAAAPNLLAALERVLLCPAMNEDSAERETVASRRSARAAIAKANV